MISFSNLTMHYGPKVLFENVSIKFDPGKRYGIVGANGSGKSTLLRIISGEEEVISGEMSIPKNTRIGILDQDHFRFENQRVVDVVIQGKPQLWDALEEKEQLLEKDIDDKVGHRLGELEEIIAHQDGYNAESFAAELLTGLGIEQIYHEGPMTALSGGFKLRVLLAQVLFLEPEVLVLDEPTNHLDIVSIAWLENFLKTSFKGTLLLVSHDRDFLNAVSNQIADVDYETIILYTGTYDDFMAAKMLSMEQRLREVSSQEKKIAEMQSFVDRFRAKATKARQAQSRVKRIEKIEINEVKPTSRVAPNLRFVPKRHSGKEVVSIKDVSKSYGDKKVLHDVNSKLYRNEKIAIIGPNGIGKSTLLKVILGETKADTGTYDWGHETYVSYFPQDHGDAFKGEASIYDWLYHFAPQESIGTIRGLLGRMLFSGDDVKKQVNALSGGECARMMFAKMTLENGNVLVLDEPTNHLDVEGIEALEDALQTFDGTVVFVSHDRRFVSNIATRILAITEEGLENFEGSYDDYLESHGDDYLDRTGIKVRGGASLQKSKKIAVQLSYEERREMKRQLSQLNKKNNQLEKKIETNEAEIAKIDTQFGEADFFQTAPPEKIQKLQKKKDQLEKEMEKTMEQWEKNLEDAEETKELLGSGN